jgi:hypothetical protein
MVAETVVQQQTLVVLVLAVQQAEKTVVLHIALLRSLEQQHFMAVAVVRGITKHQVPLAQGLAVVVVLLLVQALETTVQPQLVMRLVVVAVLETMLDQAVAVLLELF